MIRYYTPYSSSDMQFQRGKMKFYKYDFMHGQYLHEKFQQR